MAERYWGRIQFPASMIDAGIKEALEHEGAEFGPDGQAYPRPDEVWTEDGIFSLDDQQARYGCFENLEALLKQKGVPFDRESGAYFEYIPELVIFRPAQKGTPALDITFNLSDGVPVVDVQKIRNLLPQGIEAVKAYLDEHFPAYPPLSEA
ncbi:MAG: hypothetical protein QME78_00220 [Thermodesulfobacteriota bacterium]|nr:hypothetical protein [Thermodesulfobacteriota bacterium]